MKILILFAHPTFQKSQVNQRLISGLNSLEGVTVNDLYELYPEFDIDVKREQKLLVDNDCIIFHHPMFWYNMPAILIEWMDLVLQHGWAYGKTGTALQGKVFFNVVTTGGPKKAFQSDGMHGHTVKQLLTPINLTARRCGMVNLPPFVIHGTHAIKPDEIEMYKKSYIQLLNDLRNDQIDINKFTELDYLNDYKVGEGK